MAHRWRTVSALHATTEIVYPFGLTALVAGLIDGQVPESPVILPWPR